MIRACRPFTAWRCLTLAVCAALLLAPRAARTQTCTGVSCARASFGDAPRSFAAGDGPVSVAVADFDEDGTSDLVVASNLSNALTILKGVGTGYDPGVYVPVPATAPRGVAVADFNLDGHADVVATLGNGAGKVQIFLGSGTGGFTPQAAQSAGNNTSAVVVGDFNGDGAPDVAATAEGSSDVWVFLGDGRGGLSLKTTISLPTGAGPRALAAADLDGDGDLDLAVANSALNTVSILLNNGDGTFTAGPILGVGQGPWGIAAADLNGDGKPDLVTADHGASRVSVLIATGGGNFAATVPITVDATPSAVALLDVTGTAALDIAVVTGAKTLDVLEGNGAGGFGAPAAFPVRTTPSAIAAVDADGDGRLDLAIACKGSDSVAVLLSRPPGFAAAPRVAVGQKPTSAVSVDLDGDGALDLAVVNAVDGTVSLLTNDGAGNFQVYDTRPVGPSPESIVAADFNRDGRVDLAVTSTTTNTVSLLIASGTPGSFAAYTSLPAGPVPGCLAVGDFDRNGTLDLAVCNKETAGTVTVLLNDGSGVFSVGGTYSAGVDPTAIFVADLNGDGALDLAVVDNNNSAATDGLTVLLNNGSGVFSTSPTLGLAGDTGPVSVTGGDFGGNGNVDLAVAVFGAEKIDLFTNSGTGSFSGPVGIPAPDLPLFLTTADLNRDGKPDLAVAATGLKVLRGKGAMGFEAGQDFLARLGARGLAVGDFNRDGWPDVAVVNYDSNDVSILLSTACAARLIALATQPATCGTGVAPYSVPAMVQVLDDGGNRALCATGTVTASKVPGTGPAGGSLGGTTSYTLTPTDQGLATFPGLLLSPAGGGYRLRFDLPGTPPAISRSITLGLQTTITGPPSLCPAVGAGSTGVYSATTGFGSYRWTLDAVPSFYTPSVTLSGPSLAAGAHALAVDARADGCLASASKSVYVGNLASVTVTPTGLLTVCVDCIGGTLQAVETGGGPVSRQWKYRAVPAGADTPIPGETGDTYVIKGSDLPGPGSYEVFVTTTPTCGSAVTSNRVTVTVGAPVPGGEVFALAATSRGSSAASSGENVLQWVNTTGSADEIRIRWNKAPTGTSGCMAPSSATSPVTSEVAISNPPPTSRGTYTHSGLETNTGYCYAVFVRTSGTYSPGRVVKARPFDATGPVKWAYATGATAVAPPVVGTAGVLAMSNDRVVHSVVRGSAGGVWPEPWTPAALGGVAHSRSPIVPFRAPVGGASAVFFSGNDAGEVTAVDAQYGTTLWTRSLGAANPVVGAPGGYFQQWAALLDLVLVGTYVSTGPNAIYALRLSDGGDADSPFTNGGNIGPIAGAPAIDYNNNRVYFASRSYAGGPTVWCLQISASAPVLSVKWSRSLGDMDTSPVLNNGRVYVANNSGVVYSLDPATGSDLRTFNAGSTELVKGFLFPDRRNHDLMFATTTKVWSIADTGPTTMTKNWEWTQPGLTPSVVLYWPETSFVYVGSANGQLVEIDFSGATPTVAPSAKSIVLGDGVGNVGIPSLDIGVTPRMLLVGSESGVLYGVEVSLP